MTKGNGDAEEEDGDEGEPGDGPVVRAAKRPARHPKQSLDNDDEHRGLDADKRSYDQRHMTEQHIGDAEAKHDEGARQYEQEASR